MRLIEGVGHDAAAMLLRPRNLRLLGDGDDDWDEEDWGSVCERSARSLHFHETRPFLPPKRLFRRSECPAWVLADTAPASP